MLNVISGLLAGGVAASTNSYESIATGTGTGSNTTISFTSIPSTYKHLQLRMILRGTTAAVANGTDIRFNSDSATNYSLHRLIGNGSAASADGYANTSAAWALEVDASGLASTYAASVVDVLDYADTNKYKTVRVLTGYDHNGSGQIILNSNAWRSTSAINRIDVIAAGSGNWATGTSIALYGIKG